MQQLFCDMGPQTVARWPFPNPSPCQAISNFFSLRCFEKKHKTVAVGGHPNPPHCPMSQCSVVPVSHCSGVLCCPNVPETQRGEGGAEKHTREGWTGHTDRRTGVHKTLSKKRKNKTSRKWSAWRDFKLYAKFSVFPRDRVECDGWEWET